MTTTEELQELLYQAQHWSDRADPFLRAFLDAPVYALAPLSDDHPRLRLFMFKRPHDEVHFVPLFTDEEKATASASGHLRVLAGSGRLWFEASMGAVVVINPNDEHCTLYPEEVASLLATGHVADLDCEKLSAPRQVWIREPESVPDWLIEQLRALYATLPFVEAARLFEMGLPSDVSKWTLTLAITTTKSYAERAAIATITSVQPACRSAQLPLDVVSTVSDDPAPQFVDQGLLIYTREA